MLGRSKIEQHAREAARVAYAVLGLDCFYRLVFVHKPDIIEDALFDPNGNQVQLNLSRLKPFTPEIMPSGKLLRTEEERVRDEDHRHIMKVLYLIFHEMRHLYQKRVVQAYVDNEWADVGDAMAEQEDEATCALWREELKAPESDADIEEDANAFAYYLTCRYPNPMPMFNPDERHKAIKRKYDEVALPVFGREAESLTISTSNGQFDVFDTIIIHTRYHDEQLSKGRLVKDHFQDVRAVLDSACLLRDGACYESVASYAHTEEDLAGAAHVEDVLDDLERQLDQLTGQEYSRHVASKGRGSGFRFTNEVSAVHGHIVDLRDGRYYENKERYRGRRGIPRISTIGRRLVDDIMDLIWRMDCGGPSRLEEARVQYAKAEAWLGGNASQPEKKWKEGGPFASPNTSGT